MQAVQVSGNPVTPLTGNFETLEWAQVFGKRQPVTTGLTWGYYGNAGYTQLVMWGGISIPNGTVTLTNTATNFLVANKTTGAVTVSTSQTNWDDVANFYRLYKIPVAGGVPTLASVEDHRAGPFGPFSAVPMRNNYSIAAQSPAATTRTYITGSAIAIPAGKLKIGTMFKWSFDMTKTAAGNAASTIDVAVGTAGTTADTARVSFTKPAGTAVADHGTVDIMVTCRGPLSASGRFAGTMKMVHNLAATGHMVIPCMSQFVLSGTFDVTVASLIVGLCITTGASDAITIEQVQSFADNIG